MAKPKAFDAAPTTPTTDAPAPLPPTLAERVALAVEAERNAEWERIETKIDEVFGPGLDMERCENGAGKQRVRCGDWIFSLTSACYKPVHLQVFACIRDYADSPLCWRCVLHASDLSRMAPKRALVETSAAAPAQPRKPLPRWTPQYWGDVFYRWANGYK